MRAGSAVGLVFLFFLSACAGGGAPPSSASAAPSGSADGDEPGATRGSREAAHADEVAPSAPAGEARALFTVVRLGAVEAAEDGLGATIAASDAVAIDLDARRFPPRALDPVLEVGRDLRFRHYTHPAPGVLRFVVADGAVLERGEELAVQYGDDARSRVVLEAASAGGAPSSPPTSSPPTSPSAGAVTP